MTFASNSTEDWPNAGGETLPRTCVEWLDIATMASGESLKLTLHLVDSGMPGPRLGLVAALHGDETVAIEVIRRVIDRLRETDWRGSVVAVPLANPLAFSARTRSTPIDMLNLNRVFPGDKGGYLTEQIAHALYARLAGAVDALIDFHGADGEAVNDYIFLPPEGSPVFHSARKMALAFGQTWNYQAPLTTGSFTQELMADGIPAIVPEFGGGSFDFERYVEMGTRGVFNVMSLLKMCDEPIAAPADAWVVTDRRTLRAAHGGIYVPKLGPEQLGEEVQRGQVLAEIIHPATFEVLEEVRSPFERGVLLLARGRSRVHPGDYCFLVADLASARKVADD